MLENLLSIRIIAQQHELEWAEEMVEKLGCSIVLSEGENEWTTARRAWMELAEDRGEFALVIRANVDICDDFVDEVHKLIIRTYHYRTLYQLYGNQSQNILREKHGESEEYYYFTRELTDSSAVIIPKNLIKDMVRYGNQSFYNGDEAKIKTFCLRYGVPITLPKEEIAKIRYE